MLLKVVASLTVSLVFAQAAAAPRTLRPDDLYALREVSSPTVAPDGNAVAYLVTQANRDADEQRTELRLLPRGSHEPVLLAGPAATLRSPQFSPDGRFISYIGSGHDSKGSQIMLLDRRGGEARVLTRLDGNIGEYVWSPDGRQLLVVVDAAHFTPVDGHDRPQPVVIRDWHFKQDVDGYYGADRSRHLQLVTVASGEATPLTTDPAFQEDHPAFAPDGRHVAFVRSHEKGGDRDGAADVVVLDLHEGSPRVLARNWVPNLQKLEFTPDGQHVLFRLGAEPRFYAYQQDQLAMVSVAGGDIQTLSDHLDRAVMNAIALPDSQSALVTVEDNGHLYPGRLLFRTGQNERLTSDDLTVTEIARGGSTTVAVAASDTTPSEIYALTDGHWQRLSFETAPFMDSVTLGEVDNLTFRSTDGTEVHGLVTFPPG